MASGSFFSAKTICHISISSDILAIFAGIMGSVIFIFIFIFITARSNPLSNRILSAINSLLFSDMVYFEFNSSTTC
ncbi:MAG: hypothetical protein B6229_03550 [Spirochaetaceae bacterium 4572_7]|nr:MAG: hypothetical protein B6229_03550 [Spirochaetaceae bacterium 4572_7]